MKTQPITIKTVKMVDEHTDLSYLGQFSDIKGKFAIEHDGGRNQYKYFNAENVENLKEARQNYDIMMKYENGHVCDYGITATAEIVVNGVCQKITSGGLWGLSSECDDSEFKEVADDQIADLKEILKKLGFKKFKVEE